MGERDCGLDVFPDLRGTSNDLSAVHQLSILTSD